MEGVSSQALALALVLSPGFLFMFGTYVKPPYPVRAEIQRGVLIDTAVFVIATVLINLLASPFLYAALRAFPGHCSVLVTMSLYIRSLAPDTHGAACPLGAQLGTAAIYTLFIWGGSFVLGRLAAKLSIRNKDVFYALYGPYCQLARGNPVVIANVLTKTAHEDRVLAYEGLLVELSLAANRQINFVCLEGAQRFYLRFGDTQSETTPRDDFQPIDRPIDGNPRPISRLTIAGAEIANLVTRTYELDVDSAWRRFWRRLAARPS